ncbi:GNAT family N-acetyltransferase [Solibacillus daqui]|uniref:GNAT family N-acetyltransferase n=1 Tax=Solibacillus daqui TaxID=2912187 RepID=UPI002365708E|nr:N-acetyltransferase [Solibacillus daqui]
MTTFEQLTVEQLEEAAAYIAALNSNKKFHIGFCGTEKEDILGDLHEDFVEDNQVYIFVTRNADEITGLVGFDIYDGTAEVWGPFSREQQIENQLQFWHFATAKLNQVKEFLFFINEENTFQQQFMQMIDAKKSSDELYLKRMKETFQPLDVIRSEPYHEQDFAQFEAIHSQAFPNTYNSAKTIVERLHKSAHQLIVLKENHALQGYAYFEIDDAQHSTHLEFIAIAPAYRGQGLGKQLLNEALTLIFANEAITHVTLTVNNTNTHANSLYYKTGFQKQDALLSYVLQV